VVRPGFLLRPVPAQEAKGEAMRARITAKPKPAPKPRRGYSKFGAVRTVVDGIKFASKAESRRYLELKALEQAGEIHGLLLQPKYPLLVGQHKVGTYIADFFYVKTIGCEDVVEDVKGMRTPVYRLKKKMVEAQYGITITEVA
jgi:hypothetical protein